MLIAFAKIEFLKTIQISTAISLLFNIGHLFQFKLNDGTVINDPMFGDAFAYAVYPMIVYSKICSKWKIAQSLTWKKT